MRRSGTISKAPHYSTNTAFSVDKALSLIPTTMVGITPMLFRQLSDYVDDDLYLTKSLQLHHHSLVQGTRITRVANTFVDTKEMLATVHIKSRRVWIGIADPDSPVRLVDESASAALQAWHEVLTSSSFCISMRQPATLPVMATADAMATADVAGLGGVAFFQHDSSCVWFRFRITVSGAASVWPWVGDNMQKHIATWELLAQFVLTFCIASMLPPGHQPVRCHQGTDNSAADASAAKGLSMTPGMSHILIYFLLNFMRKSQVYAEITHTSLATSTHWQTL